MRWVTVTVLVLLMGSIPLGGTAQETEENATRVLAEDVAGDGRFMVAGAELDGQAPAYADLVALTIEEIDDVNDRFDVFVTLAAPPDESSPTRRGEKDEVWVHFSWDDREFALVFERYHDFVDATPSDYATLQEYDASFDYWFTTYFSTANWNEETLQFSASIFKASLVDSDGATPQEGDVLSDFWVEYRSYVLQFDEQSVVTIDRMPDEGSASEVWEVLFGPEVTGHGLLFSERPFRASNGEATTFFYELTALNTADYADTFNFHVRDAPNGWVVTFPHEDLRIGGGQEESFPVLLTVPFAHEHGRVASLLVDMTANSDPLALSSLEIGVRYMEVPQPAGHHDTLYIHSDGFWPFLNTVQDYEYNTGESVPACCTSSSLTSSQFSWYVPLWPGLQMGLDFDLDRTGTIAVPFTVDLPIDNAFMVGEVRVVLCTNGNRFSGCDSKIVATIEPSQSASLAAQSSHTFESLIVPTEEGDYLSILDVDYQYMELYLTLATESPHAVSATFEDMSTKPMMDAGGIVNLPLNEFHDDVSGYFRALSGIELVAAGDQQKLVNPGKTALFLVDATNAGSFDATFDISVTGANQDWAGVLGDTKVALNAGETRQLAVSIQPPLSAADGELVDLVLHATSAKDENVRSLIRLLAEVDTDMEHADEGAEAAQVDDELRSTPWPLLQVVGLALVAALGRRSDQIV